MYAGAPARGAVLDSGLFHAFFAAQRYDTIQGADGFLLILLILLQTLTTLRIVRQDKKDSAGSHLGLFAYPVLMTADILLYGYSHNK